LFFITLCVKNHKHLFGEINNDEMVLNDKLNSDRGNIIKEQKIEYDTEAWMI